MTDPVDTGARFLALEQQQETLTGTLTTVTAQLQQLLALHQSDLASTSPPLQAPTEFPRGIAPTT